MRVLYVGSGRSAALVQQANLDGLTVCAANNAWRLFTPEKPCHHWIHSGDFPGENRPKGKVFESEVSYDKYSVSSAQVSEHLQCVTKSPQHHLGYTIFFQGLYWIMWTLKPSEIHLLGFDHDYDSAKAAMWKENGCPAPHNRFLKEPGVSIADWSSAFFKDHTADAFYGHGTPDPLRLGEPHLKELFTRAKEYAARLGVDVFNVSPNESTLNTFPRKPLA